jgi:hypothetical protein
MASKLLLVVVFVFNLIAFAFVVSAEQRIVVAAEQRRDKVSNLSLFFFNLE